MIDDTSPKEALTSDVLRRSHCVPSFISIPSEITQIEKYYNDKYYDTANEDKLKYGSMLYSINEPPPLDDDKGQQELDFLSVDGPMPTSIKPVLVLDLDNTLVHAVSVDRRSDLTSCDELMRDYLDEHGLPELYRFVLPMQQKGNEAVGSVPVQFYLKLRPGVRSFLRRMHSVYEMSVYTHATREYADIVLSILDPLSILFQNRMVCRVDDGGVKDLNAGKFLDRLPLCKGRDLSSIIVLDDRIDVWSQCSACVLQPRHYAHLDKLQMYANISLYDPNRSHAKTHTHTHTHTNTT
eukprot:GHVR01016624.1.p1 GENE.GHVR01016624.1~~GHVR01016624.1.p1  ORF type:complete len:295 (+),score=84.69 GHVR01016624.1:68-952(+)